jgi:hypothetical protein
MLSAQYADTILLLLLLLLLLMMMRRMVMVMMVVGVVVRMSRRNITSRTIMAKNDKMLPLLVARLDY